ncbi:MAG: cyclic nucleotide-binding domain-containing protein [Actinomycetota bacterium]
MEWELLAGLSPEERDSLLALARRRRYARNEIIFHQGDPAETLHLIESGRVSVRVTTPRGDVATLAVLGSGDFFGETSEPPADSATAVSVRTFLIADVRGYTAFTREHGDAAAARLAKKFADLARDAVEARGGQVIELRGDEALAVFTSTAQAVRAAVELQAACAEARPPERAGLDAATTANREQYATILSWREPLRWSS